MELVWSWYREKSLESLYAREDFEIMATVTNWYDVVQGSLV